MPLAIKRFDYDSSSEVAKFRSLQAHCWEAAVWYQQQSIFAQTDHIWGLEESGQKKMLSSVICEDFT